MTQQTVHTPQFTLFFIVCLFAAFLVFLLFMIIIILSNFLLKLFTNMLMDAVYVCLRKLYIFHVAHTHTGMNQMQADQQRAKKNVWSKHRNKHKTNELT